LPLRASSIGNLPTTRTRARVGRGSTALESEYRKVTRRKVTRRKVTRREMRQQLEELRQLHGLSGTRTIEEWEQFPAALRDPLPHVLFLPNGATSAVPWFGLASRQ